MAKFPFTNFFDVNGNRQMDFSEELLAMKVFEDTLHGNDLAFYSEAEDMDCLDGGWGTRGLRMRTPQWILPWV